MLERVIAGPAAVSRGIMLASQARFGPWVPVEVKPGMTTHVNIGGTGRPVVGRLVKPRGKETPIDWEVGDYSFRLKMPPMTEPPNMNPEQRVAWYKTWITTGGGEGVPGLPARPSILCLPDRARRDVPYRRRRPPHIRPDNPAVRRPAPSHCHGRAIPSPSREPRREERRTARPWRDRA